MVATLKVIDDPQPELRAVIADGLVAFNVSRAGPNNAQPLAIALLGDNERPVGGLWGKTGYNWLFIELVFVPEILRGRHLGAELVRIAETTAISRGCIGVWLDTFEFQARGFYERLGYEVFGALDDYPPGSSRYFMRKSLRVSTSP